MTQRNASCVLDEAYGRYEPMGDTETFKLPLFFIGNGSAPILFTEWILLAQYWAESAQNAEKRARQIDFVVNNADRQNSK